MLNDRVYLAETARLKTNGAGSTSGRNKEAVYARRHQTGGPLYREGEGGDVRSLKTPHKSGCRGVA